IIGLAKAKEEQISRLELSERLLPARSPEIDLVNTGLVSEEQIPVSISRIDVDVHAILKRSQCRAVSRWANPTKGGVAHRAKQRVCDRLGNKPSWTATGLEPRDRGGMSTTLPSSARALARPIDSSALSLGPRPLLLAGKRPPLTPVPPTTPSTPQHSPAAHPAPCPATASPTPTTATAHCHPVPPAIPAPYATPSQSARSATRPRTVARRSDTRTERHQQRTDRSAHPPPRRAVAPAPCTPAFLSPC